MLEADSIPDVPGFIIPEVSRHHNHGDSLLDYHMPEVLKGDLLWSNRGNELLFYVIKLDWRGIDIIYRGLSCYIKF